MKDVLNLCENARKFCGFSIPRIDLNKNVFDFCKIEITLLTIMLPSST